MKRVLHNNHNIDLPLEVINLINESLIPCVNDLLNFSYISKYYHNTFILNKNYITIWILNSMKLLDKGKKKNKELGTLLPKNIMVRLMREILEDIVTYDIKITQNSIDILLKASESYLINMFSLANKNMKELDGDICTLSSRHIRNIDLNKCMTTVNLEKKKEEKNLDNLRIKINKQ